MKHLLLLVVPLIFSSLSLAASPEGQLIDGVVATVDDEPITISDVRAVMDDGKDASVQDLRANPQFSVALEQLISEKLLTLESEEKEISVSQEEVDGYIASVAKANAMTVAKFQTTLEEQGKSFEIFKRSIKLEILRSKLGNKLVQDGGGVTEAEIQDYIDQHYNIDTTEEAQVKLAQVLVASQSRDEEAVKKRCLQVLAEFEAGSEFSALARKYSDAPEAKEGGSLGLLAEKDLNPLIRDAIESLEPGSISPIVESPAGCHIFFLENRFDGATDSTALREEVRQKLNQQNLEQKYQTYFVEEIYKNHTVEKKL